MAHESSFDFRNLLPTDLPFLKEMFYLSLFVPPGEAPFAKEIIEKPGLAKYYQDWGRENDHGIMVFSQKEKIGAVWIRFFKEANKGYGFVREDAPELGIALKETYRSQGLGQQLMERMFTALKEKQVPAVSLSTDLRNKAYHLYLKTGFVEVSREANSCIMLKNII